MKKSDDLETRLKIAKSKLENKKMKKLIKKVFF